MAYVSSVAQFAAHKSRQGPGMTTFQQDSHQANSKLFRPEPVSEGVWRSQRQKQMSDDAGQDPLASSPRVPKKSIRCQ